MPDSLPPVAIRVARPYATEEELFHEELETLTRTSVTLLGAQPRPHGVVLRFELVLSSGQVLMRGEGRVVGYKPNAHDGLGGLTLRFTRLDSRTKAVVDRAALVRDRRRPSAGAPPAEGMPVPSFPPLAAGDIDGEPVPVVETMSLAPAALSMAPPVPPFVSVAPPPPMPLSVRPPPPPPISMAPPPPPVAASPPAPESTPRAAHSAEPPSRDALLDRLRARSKSLGEDALQKLIDRRRP